MSNVSYILSPFVSHRTPEALTLVSVHQEQFPGGPRQEAQSERASQGGGQSSGLVTAPAAARLQPAACCGHWQPAAVQSTQSTRCPQAGHSAGDSVSSRPGQTAEASSRGRQVSEDSHQPHSESERQARQLVSRPHEPLAYGSRNSNVRDSCRQTETERGRESDGDEVRDSKGPHMAKGVVRYRRPAQVHRHYQKRCHAGLFSHPGPDSASARPRQSSVLVWWSGWRTTGRLSLSEVPEPRFAGPVPQAWGGIGGIIHALGRRPVVAGDAGVRNLPAASPAQPRERGRRQEGVGPRQAGAARDQMGALALLRLDLLLYRMGRSIHPSASPSAPAAAFFFVWLD